jgi:hypothetical protein
MRKPKKPQAALSSSAACGFFSFSSSKKEYDKSKK